jgi:preprotein translocase subunit SecG
MLNNMIKKITIWMLVLLSGMPIAFSQEKQEKTTEVVQEAPVEMATLFRESGKIWVVVGVLTIIFIGIIVYLVLLDRKIGKVEKLRKGI